MNRFKILIGFYIVLSSCNPSSTQKDPYNKELSNLMLSNYGLKNKLISTFNLKDNTSGIFKVVISRRDRFVRVTLYKLSNKDELNEYPSSYFIYNSNTFLCYDGSEVIDNNRVESEFVIGLKIHLQSGYINDSRVLQFDIDNKKVIKLNIPAINPYDITEQHIDYFPLIHKDTTSK